MRGYQLGRTLYSAVLQAYPKDFRARFGNEMIEVFSQEIRSQSKQHGFCGAFRVWCSAFWEVLSVAGPLRLQSSLALPVVISILASSIFAFAFFAAVTPRCIK